MQMSAYEFEEWNQSAVMALTIMLTSAFFTILVSLLIKLKETCTAPKAVSYTHLSFAVSASTTPRRCEAATHKCKGI